MKIKEEADQELQKNKSKYESVLGRFCPQINSSCRQDCVCYQAPYVSGNEFNGWHVYASCCNHVLISGGIYASVS